MTTRTRRFLTFWLITTVIGVILEVTLPHYNSNGLTTTGAVGGLLIVLAPFLAIAHFTHKFVGVIWDEGTVALTPIPSPAEITAHLQNQMGREPTLAEVASVHQMLTNRRNEAAVSAGLGVGAFLLVDHTLHNR